MRWIATFMFLCMFGHFQLFINAPFFIEKIIWFYVNCSNEDFQQSVKELKEKAEELKEVKEGLKAR